MADGRLASLVSSALPDLEVLAQDPKLIADIASALADTKPSLAYADLAQAVSEKTGRADSAVAPVVRILRRLALSQLPKEMSAESFVNALTDDLTGPDAPWSSDYQEQWKDVAPNLIRALSPGSAMYLSAKAYDLLFEQSLAVCSARIITDMRPVFDDTADTMEAILPFHTLVLKCHEGGKEGHRNIYVALDATDLEDLGEQVERAKRKEQLVKKKLASDGYAIIGVPTSTSEAEVQ